MYYRLLFLGAALGRSLALASSVKVKTSSGDGAFSFGFGARSSQYYVPSPGSAAPVASYEHISGLAASEEYVPFTVFTTDETSISDEVLEGLLSDYLSDDVYSLDFLDAAYISGPAQSVIEPSAISWLKNQSVSLLVTPSTFNVPHQSPCKGGLHVAAVDESATLPPGPYMASISGDAKKSLSLSKVYALIPDTQQAYMHGATPSDDGSFAPVSVWDPWQAELLIPVPSKLYSSLLDPAVYPLAGLRFAVKDLMPIRGLVTSGGSKSYLRLHADTPDNVTAPSVQRLIDLGAVVVGKTKLTVFAFGAWPWQTDDFAYSWNPRADGYLGLSASSYGSAAAIAAYDYLDFAIGSDTGGSVRNPADRVGVYGLRPSWDAFDTTDVIPSAVSLDSLGFFARTPGLMKRVGRAWAGEDNEVLRKGPFKLPKKIFYPTDFFPVATPAAQSVIDAWLSNVTSALSMALEPQNVTSLFAAHVSPTDTLANYTSRIFDLSSWDNYHLFGAQFLADYRAASGYNATPVVDLPAYSAYFETIPTLTRDDKDFSEARRADFDAFVNSFVIPAEDDTCTSGLWVYHISDKGGGVPEYRDVITYDEFPDFVPMRGASIAPYARLVDVTVPIGTVAYDSVISMREEPLVITLNVVAHTGCDEVVLDFLEACEGVGLCRGGEDGEGGLLSERGKKDWGGAVVKGRRERHGWVVVTLVRQGARRGEGGIDVVRWKVVSVLKVLCSISPWRLNRWGVRSVH